MGRPDRRSHWKAGRRMAAESEATREDRGLGLGAVFLGLGSTLRLAAAGAAAALVGAALERRHVLLSLLAAVAGLAVAIGVLVFPGSTWAGIPTRETVEAVQDAMARVARDAA